MFWIHLSLGIVDGLFLAAVAVLGYLRPASLDPQVHVAAGLLAGVFTVFTHSLVFIYFMGSGKSLREAVLRHGLGESPLEPLPRIRGRAFPWAWAVCLLATAAAILGGGVWGGLLAAWVHGAAALLTVLGAWVALPFELRSIAENGRILAAIQAAISSRPPETPEREVEEHVGLVPLGKGLLLTGASVWGVYAYMRWIMKEEVRAFPWFVLLSLLGAGLGLILIRRESARRARD